jgi:PAS domain S-box-containing protein
MGLLEYKIHQQIVGTILFIIALNLAVAIALGAMLFYASKRIILTPIAELSRAASRLANGDLSAHVTTKTTGEIRQLVDSFNQMAADVEKTTVSRDYVDSIIHSMADTLIVLNTDGTIKTVNAALVGLLGYEEELVGKHLKTVFPGDSKEAESLVSSIRKEGWVSSCETVYISRSGKIIPMLVSGASIQDKNGDSRGFVLIGKDITERKKAEEHLQRYAGELRESNNEIQNFSYIISHDLRAPLVSIKGFSAELDHTWKDIEAIIGKYLSGMDGKDRSRLDTLVRQDIYEALKFIASSADRMEGLINSILTLSRVGRRELMPEPIDMGTLTRRLVDSLAHQIGEKNIRVTIGALPVVTVDGLAMEQIMGNLLDNAVKYSDAGKPGDLTVTAEERGEEHVVHVRDSGRGIAPDDIPKVFDIFKRVGRQDVPGEGMGLAYVKALVKRHNGRIWCESEAGVGTTFSFSLPVQAGMPGAQGHGGGRS